MSVPKLTIGRSRFRRPKTRVWEKAELIARVMEDAAHPNKLHVRERIKIEDAIHDFRADEQSPRLSRDSQRKSEFFFEKQLRVWAGKQGFVFLDQLRPAELTKFRTQWKNGSATTRRKHERLVAFFWLCVRLEWLDKESCPAAETSEGGIKAHRLFPESGIRRYRGRHVCLWQLGGWS